jgi:outer membrane protein
MPSKTLILPSIFGHIKTKLSILTLVVLSAASLRAQDTTSLSLSQALDYAMSNNVKVKNAYADLEIANQTVKEVKALGIPQAKASVAFQDAIQKQVFVFPVNGVGTPIRVGNKYTTQASLNFSWLLLDGTYFLGLKSAKQFTDLSKKAATNTETEVKIDVAKTYFMCLISKENVSLLNSNIQTLAKMLNEVKALNKEGFSEALDVDRMQLQLNNLQINQKQVNDQYEVLLGLLKSKIGMSQNQALKLSDGIDALNSKVTGLDTNASMNLSKRTDYQLLQQQLVLNKLNVKRYEFGKYPNLAAAYTYQQSNFGETIDYSSKNWFGNSFLALQLNVPIFAGFANNAKIQKAKIEQLQTENTIANVENMIQLEVMQTKLTYMRALEFVDQQKENLDLANRILKTTTIKYNEGVGSNLELITANQDLKTTQTNYLNAVYNLLVAKLDYIVAIGDPIKL